MYAYYGLAAIGPHMQKYLWWKKYLTRMQMVQFIVVMAHVVNAIQSDCGFPPVFMWILFIYMITLFIQFFQFYIAAYSKKEKSS